MQHSSKTIVLMTIAGMLVGCTARHDAAPLIPEAPNSAVGGSMQVNGIRPDAMSGIAEFATKPYQVYGPIASDRQGTEWVASSTPAALVTFRESTHAVASLPLPAPDQSNLPIALALSPSGDAVWFAGPKGELGSYKPSNQQWGQFDLSAQATLVGITAGPDHAMWFTKNRQYGHGGENAIGRIGVVQHNVTQFALSNGDNPVGITLGNDGALWFADANSIGRITTGGTIDEYSIGSNFARAVTTGPDGAIWFTGESHDQRSLVGRIDLTTHVRKLIDYGPGPGNGNFGIVTRGTSLWMTSNNFNSIDHYDTAAHIVSRHALPHGYTSPLGIALGADNQLWFTNFGPHGAAVGKLCPNQPSSQCKASP
jgi:virginiamycin B lyase